MSSTKTGIEWTDKTWNPATGCTKISEGCLHCYAEEITKRFPNGFPNGFKVTLHPDRLREPLAWRKPSKVFVNSMSDLFHEEIPFEFVDQVMAVAMSTPRHIYQILTKRPERMAQYFSESILALRSRWLEQSRELGLEEDFFGYINLENTGFLPNVWLGVSVENQRHVHRIDRLREVPATVRFLSCEPLLESLPDLNLEGIHWVIVGGESGTKHRPFAPEWAESIRQQCIKSQTAFFFKQHGGRTPKAGGSQLFGKEYKEFPL